MTDQIIISQLVTWTRIGATAEERREPQKVCVSLTLESRDGLRDLDDKLENTVDYAVLAGAVKAHAATGERTLIETLAEEIASLVLRHDALEAVEVEVRKYILPDTEFVAVKIRREAGGGSSGLSGA